MSLKLSIPLASTLHESMKNDFENLSDFLNRCPVLFVQGGFYCHKKKSDSLAGKIFVQCVTFSEDRKEGKWLQKGSKYSTDMNIRNANRNFLLQYLIGSFMLSFPFFILRENGSQFDVPSMVVFRS
jgi:hypothetical protein